MKAYVVTAGTVFGLITLAHIWRFFAENPRMAPNPWFLLITVVAAALSIWAWRLVWLSSRADSR